VNQRGPLIAGAVTAVLAILLVMFLVLPKMHQVTEAKDELSQAQDQEQELRLQLAQLEQAQREAPEATREIRTIDNEVPPTTDEEGLVLLASGAADRAGVDLNTLAPSAPTPSADGSFSIIPTQMIIGGSYFGLEEFLYNLESLPRAAKVTTLSIATNTTGSTTEGSTTTTVTDSLTMTITVEFYTTDLSAGPGSDPGPSQTTTTTGA
jgi:Tfp pilus assembly protein PilO